MAIYTRQYTQGVGWENEPSVNTPINAENLNQMDTAALNIDSAVKNAFDAVETAIENACGNALSDHITSVGGTGNAYLITSTDIFDGQAPNDNDLLFLYSEVNAELSNLSLWWHVKFGTSGTITGSIVDLRDGNSGSTYTGNISAGSVLILTKIPAAEAQDDWALRAIIPAAGGGGGTTVIANPSGLPTLNLNKLMVDDVIYAIHSGADVVIAETGTTDTTGYILDIDRSLAGIKAWDIVEIKVNANYTFKQNSGALSLSRAWGLSYAQSSWTVNNTLRCVESSDFLSAYFRPDLKKGDSILAICYAFELDNSPMLLVVGLFNASRPVIPTRIDHPQRGEILRYNDVRKTWENEKESANVIVLSTGTTDTTGHSIDIDVNINAVEVGNILEFRINANYTFSGGSSYNGWGVSYPVGEVSVERNNVLRRVSSGNSIYFDNNLKKGDSVFAVCTGFFDAVPNLLVIAVYNADGTALGDLNNVDISTPTDGQYLKYDSTSSKWVNASGGGGGGSSTLAGLDDTTIASPTAAQPLTYDATNSKWVNGGVIPAANGGTGNNTGYIQTGRKANTTIGGNATAEGIRTTASGNQSHAEGVDTVASNTGAHAEGGTTQATGVSSHAEGGGGVVASGISSHAEGASTTASGHYSHAEGQSSKAQANATHAQNFGTTASANYSSAAGYYTTAGYQSQFVIGKYNNNKSTSIFEVGIGTANNAKANGLELDTSGNLKTAGTITDGQGHVLGQAVVADGVWVISGETATLTVTTP